jgi:hypothetical protein
MTAQFKWDGGLWFVVHRTIQLLAITLAINLISACGDESSKKSGKGADRSSESSEVLGIDTDNLTATHNRLSSESGREPLWRIRVAINGNELVKLEAATLTDVSDAVKSLEFKRGDVVRFEMTLFDKANPSLVLATNLEEVAEADESLKSVWDAQCEGSVSAEVSIIDLGTWMFDGANGGQGKITLAICDFAAITLKEMVEIKPQRQILEAKTVIYHCDFAPSIQSDYVYTFGKPSCPYGYLAAPGETEPEITILKKYAPGEPLFDNAVPVLTFFTLEQGNGGGAKLSADFSAPAFGSSNGCYQLKMDVKYGTSSGAKAARLVFDRLEQADGSVIWAPKDSASWPSVMAIRNYYAGAGEAERVHVYSVCRWIPETEDATNGSVVVFNRD